MEESELEYITVLDHSDGRVYQYENLEHLEGGWNGDEKLDAENIKWYLIRARIIEVEKIDVNNDEVSNSIRQAINQNATQKKEIESYYKDINNKDYRKFAIVRNPYERMVSMYAYLNGFLTGKDLLNTYQWDNKSESYKIAETMKLNVDGFKEFVKDPTGEGWGDAWRLRLLNKQCYWVDKTVTILKYENLEDELSEFFGEKIDLQIINKTIHDDFSVYYDEESLDIVYNRYKEDFKRFNYDNRKI